MYILYYKFKPNTFTCLYFNSYEVQEPKDQQWGAKLGNGSWTGMIGHIMKKVDTSL